MVRQDPIALAATLPCWGGRVSPVPLAGGLTNDNFLVEDGGERYVVRVGGDIPAHNIVRSTEAAASRAAHVAGVSPHGQCHIDTQLAGRIECGIAREHEKNKLRWISVSA